MPKAAGQNSADVLWVILDDLRPQLARAYGQQAMASLTPASAAADEATSATADDSTAKDGTVSGWCLGCHTVGL